MSKSKKTTLNTVNLVEIALALNKNINANKRRSSEKKINNDIFIVKKFGINRKKFSAAIKDTPIKYNKSTHLYDIPKGYTINDKVIPKSFEKNTPKKALNEPKSNVEVSPSNNNSSNDLVMIETKTVQAIKSIIKTEYPGLKEMMIWYQSQRKKESVIDIPEININHTKLQGEIMSKSFKTYKAVLEEFIEFSKKRKETQKDLVALALIEFIQRYKKS